VRSAISLLLAHEFYAEAGGLLKATGHVAQAGRLYVKAKAWDQAKACFTLVGDKRAIAQCAVRLGKYDEAAPLFEKLGSPLVAAQCYAKCREWRQAGALYCKNGQTREGLDAYLTWLREQGDGETPKLEADEVAIIAQSMATSVVEVPLVNLLDAHGETFLLLKELICQDRQRLAIEIYANRTASLGPELYAWAQSEAGAAEKALALCQEVGDHLGIARILESLHRWPEAALAFETAGVLPDAYACYVKGELWDELDEFKKRAAPKQLPVHHQGAQLLSADSALSSPGPVTLSGWSAKPAQAVARARVGALAVPPPPPGGIIQKAAFPSEMAPNELRPDQSDDVFSASNLFVGLSGQERDALWGLGVVKRFIANQVIIDFGDMPAGTFTILEGEVVICRKRGDHNAEPIDQAGRFQTFGESWSLLSMRADVRVQAKSDCAIHVIERQALNRFVKHETDFGEQLYSRLVYNLVVHLMGRINPGALTAMSANL